MSKLIEFIGTPEAGKTTCVHRIKKDLEQKGFKVEYVRESAEILPASLRSNDYLVNLWTCTKTIGALAEAVSNKSVDFILADRGIFDCVFWFNCLNKFIPVYEAKIAEDFFKSLHIKQQDLLCCLYVPPEVAIKRKGREGRIVNNTFLDHYNTVLLDLFTRYSRSKLFINTADLTVDEVVALLIKSILAQ